MILLKAINALHGFLPEILRNSIRASGSGSGSKIVRILKTRTCSNLCVSSLITWNNLRTSTVKSNVSKLLVREPSAMMQQYNYGQQDYTSDQFPAEQPRYQKQQLPTVVLKLRGLPWTSSVTDIIEFFGSSVNIANGNDGIHLITTPEGRATGEAYIEVVTEDDVQAGLKKNKNTMGHRYIEVFKAKRTEMEWILRKNDASYVGSNDDGWGLGYGGGYGGHSTVGPIYGPVKPEPPPNPFANLTAEECETFVRLRGLPFECSTNDIFQFFKGLEVDPNGIHMIDDGSGRNTGEAYIQLTSKEDADKALELDRQCIGHRYIEVFRVGASELRNYSSLSKRGHMPSRYSSRPSPYDRPLRGGRFGNDYGRRSQRYFGGRETGYDDSLPYTYDGSHGSEGGTGSGWNRLAEHNHLDPPLIPGLKRSGANGFEDKNWLLMRGLPFKSKESDILEFFQPLTPASVEIIYDASGRPSGTAKVEFASPEDVNAAMTKDKNLMEHRYIELFPGGL